MYSDKIYNSMCLFSPSFWDSPYGCAVLLYIKYVHTTVTKLICCTICSCICTHLMYLTVLYFLIHPKTQFWDPKNWTVSKAPPYSVNRTEQVKKNMYEFIMACMGSSIQVKTYCHAVIGYPWLSKIPQIPTVTRWKQAQLQKGQPTPRKTR